MHSGTVVPRQGCGCQTDHGHERIEVAPVDVVRIGGDVVMQKAYLIWQSYLVPEHCKTTISNQCISAIRAA